MKIRTDFVTNSSSSSFVVDLNLELVDGTTISIIGHEFSGDDTSIKRLSFVARDSNENTIASGGYDLDGIHLVAEEMFGVYLSPVDLIKISSASSIETLIDAITMPFCLDCHHEIEEMYFEEGEYEYEDEVEIAEQLTEKFNSMVDDCGAVLNAHLTKVSDLKNSTVSMEFSGWGEGLKGPDEIINYVFGYKIVDILSEDDEGEIREKLCALTNFSEEAISTLLDFWKNRDCEPDGCKITQTLRADGKVDLVITRDIF